jgi:hypothetical protein
VNAVFTKQSRYRQVPDIAVTDARSRVLAAKDTRPLPNVTGMFQHTVDSSDRLDQLGYSYYGDPLQYWHICDANPQFLSPLALLGTEPVARTVFPLTAVAADPPWAAVLSALHATLGVEDVTIQEQASLVEQRQTAGGQQVTVVVRRFSRVLLVTYNRISIDAAALSAVIAAAGFTVGPPADIGQLGQQIVIPPAVTG